MVEGIAMTHNQRYKLTPLDEPGRYELKIYHCAPGGMDWYVADIIEADLQMLISDYILHDTGLRVYKDRRK